MDKDLLIQQKIDAIITLLQNLLALELSNNGVKQELIAKRLHVARAKVVKMLQGVKKDR